MRLCFSIYGRGLVHAAKQFQSCEIFFLIFLSGHDNKRRHSLRRSVFACPAESELLRAYRNKVKNIHPDKGGDRKVHAISKRFREGTRVLAHMQSDPAVE